MNYKSNENLCVRTNYTRKLIKKLTELPNLIGSELLKSFTLKIPPDQVLALRLDLS